MDTKIASIFTEMLKVNHGDRLRIEHTVKVHNYAKQLGVLEKLSKQELFVLETAAILHDIGIQISLKKYQSSAAKYQELEGPAIAKNILVQLNIEKQIVDRVCFLIAHHHTFSAIDDTVFQLLVEADFLVNAVEDNYSEKQIHAFEEKVFRTQSGKLFIHTLKKS